jgi:hypothetical protein
VQNGREVSVTPRPYPLGKHVDGLPVRVQGYRRRKRHNAQRLRPQIPHEVVRRGRIIERIFLNTMNEQAWDYSEADNEQNGERKYDQARRRSSPRPSALRECPSRGPPTYPRRQPRRQPEAKKKLELDDRDEDPTGIKEPRT